MELIENLYKKGVKTITMYRMNMGNKRFYITQEPFLTYSGLTGALSAATFKGNQDAKRLTKWRDKMISHLGGQEQQEAYLNSMADFGTLLHMVGLRIKEQGKLAWSYEQEYATKFFEESARVNGIPINHEIIRQQVFEYCKSAASLLQFFYDNVMDVYAIEGVAKCDDLRIATPIDLVCRIKENKGESIVTLNLKTSSQFSDHQREQCAVERYLWNTTYPELQANKTGLLRAKDWSLKKGIPTYELELLDEQVEYNLVTDARKRLDLVRSNPNSTYLNFPENTLRFTGESLLGEIPKIEIKSLESIINTLN